MKLEIHLLLISNWVAFSTHAKIGTNYTWHKLAKRYKTSQSWGTNAELAYLYTSSFCGSHRQRMVQKWKFQEHSNIIRLKWSIPNDLIQMIFIKWWRIYVTGTFNHYMTEIIDSKWFDSKDMTQMIEDLCDRNMINVQAARLHIREERE